MTQPFMDSPSAAGTGAKLAALPDAVKISGERAESGA